MKLKTALITASTLAILSGCADLGFGDFPLADATDETAGPVMVADLETTNVATAPPMPEKGPVMVADLETTDVATAPPMPEKGPVMSSPLPEITVADLRAPELPRPTPQAAPQAAPVARQAGIAAQRGHPNFVNKTPMTAADNASTDPTERSIPPTINTSVMPTAMKVRSGIWLAMVDNVDR